MSSDGTDFEGGEEFPERPFGGRPFGGRPFGGRRGEERPFGGRPFGGRPFGGRPFGGRPFGGRPFGGRPFGGRPFGGRRGEAEGDGYLDPDEWSADVAELVCERSAVIRLGATLVASDQELPVNAFDAQAGFRAPGAAGPPAAVGVPGAPAMLHPGDHELEAGVVVTPEVRRALEANPGLADEIKVDLAEALARGADQQFLQTIAAHVPPPLGVVPGDLLATARGVVAAVRPAGPPFPPVFRNPGWILAPDTLELLTTLPTADCLVAGGPGARTLDSYRILQLDGVDGGVFLGYAFALSAGAAAPGANSLYFAADWQEALVGIDPSFVSVQVSTEAPPAPPGRGVVIRASMPLDFALRRVGSFAWA